MPKAPFNSSRNQDLTMNATEFASRRARLMAAMGASSLAIIPAASEQLRNRDVHYPFRQDSDFHYLTGFPEPDAVAVLIPGRAQGQYVLFCRNRDPQAEIWTGYRAGPEGALQRYGCDEAHSLEVIDEVLPRLLADHVQRVFYTLGNHPCFDERLIGWLRRLREQARGGIQPPAELIGLDGLLHEMRLFKSETELGVMRRAGQITAAAHRQAMQYCRPGFHEYQLAAEFTHAFAREGGEHAYPPIVGGGGNACILHYTENDQPLKDGDLVLIDAGGEFECYAADITRTFPVNGRFSGEQRAIYELVLAAQDAAIAQVRCDRHWNQPHEAAVAVLSQGLLDLELLQGSLDEVIGQQLYRRFYMHRTGHWLGLDVHDVGSYQQDGQWRPLTPGMVLTVEPGLYIRPDPQVAERWWNIGVRIEDDVLVTAAEPEILTRDAPKQIADIEAVMRT